MRESTHWVWGRHSVLEALRSGTARSVLVAAGRRPAPILAEIGNEAARRNVLIREVPSHEIERIAPGQNTQGVAAEVVARTLSDVPALLSTIDDRAVTPFLLALDQVQDP